MNGQPIPYPALRAVATTVHAVYGAVGELSWLDGTSVEVRPHPASALHPCALRQHLAVALARGSCEELSALLGRHGEADARLLAGPTSSDLGGGVQRFELGRQVFDPFATDLEPHAAGRAAIGAATLPATFRAGPYHHPAPGGLGVGVARDELTRIILVWLAYPSDGGLREEAAEAAWAMAGACAVAELVHW